MACNGVLDESPDYSVSSSKVFSDNKGLKSVLLEDYGHLASINLYGRSLWLPVLSNGTLVGTTTGEMGRATRYNVDPTDDTWLGNSWRQIYKVISESNYTLRSLENSDIDQEIKDQAIGHAHFLRGYAYYMLGTLWGKAPLILEPITKKNLETPVSNRKALYAQAESDLKIATEKLVGVKSATSKGVADSNAAKAFLMKLYFMQASQKQAGIEASDLSAQELWAKVREIGTPLVGKYNLEPNFANLFAPHATSVEAIFQLNYSNANGVQKRWNQLFGPMSYASKSPSFRNVRIDKAFYDFHLGTHPNDARIAGTYLNQWKSGQWLKASYPFTVFKNKEYVNLRDYMIKGSDPKNPRYDLEELKKDSKTKLLVDKIFEQKNNGAIGNDLYPYNKKAADASSDAQFDKINTILMRYADVLLMLADAENELGNSAQAKEYLNQVLKRAKLESVADLDKDAMREYIFFERMFEFAGEPFLYEDIRRRGIEYLRKVIKIHNDSWVLNQRYNFEKKVNYNGAFGEVLINNGNSDDLNFLKKALVLPIPQSEINYNSKITQSDQNFGY
ncbi:RagB/SusD family nutrient uptake outer membrane protein [Ornithobacterium rhinotracheale]